jgi:hypothetical protein
MAEKPLRPRLIGHRSAKCSEYYMYLYMAPEDTRGTHDGLALLRGEGITSADGDTALTDDDFRS